MKLTVINKTDYSGRDLRSFFLAGLHEYGIHAETRPMRVTVVYARRSRVTGYAYYPKEGVPARITMRLPKPEHLGDLKELAQVFFHEIGHTLGLRHREMAKWTSIHVEFYLGCKIGFRVAPEPAKKPRVSLVERRAKRARDKVVELERKLKRVESRLKVWRKKVRYYENRGVIHEGSGEEQEVPARTHREDQGQVHGGEAVL